MSRFVITAVLQLQAPRNLQTIVSQINRQLSGIQANINVKINSSVNNQINNMVNNINRARNAVNNFNSDLERAGYNAGKTLRRYAGFTAATGAFIALGRAISSGIKDALDYEVTLNKIRQVTGSATRDLGGLNREITNLATSLGVSSNKIAQAALTLSQAGLSADKTKSALEALAKTELTATFDDIVDTTEGAIAIFQQFNVEAQDLEKVLGSINTVSAKFAVESSDIVTAVRRTGGAFAAAGGNLNELIALFTSVRQTTRESAESIATGFRTIFTRLQRVRTQDFLKTLGIDLRDIEGQFVGPYEAVKRLSEALKGLESTDPRFAQVVEELGGFRQVSKVIPLIQKFDVSQRALNIAQRSGNSITEDAAKAQETLSNRIAKVREEFAALLRKLSASDTFKAFVNIMLNLASSFIKVADSLTPLIPLLGTIGAVKLGSGIREFFGREPGKGFRGGALGFATGGLVPGSGSGDTVPAMLTPGEFVIRKNAVKAIGAEKLAGMNRYANGGKETGIYTLGGKQDPRTVAVRQLIANGAGLSAWAEVPSPIQKEFNLNLNGQVNSEQIKKFIKDIAQYKNTKQQQEITGNKINGIIGNDSSPTVAGLYAKPTSSDKPGKTFFFLKTIKTTHPEAYGKLAKAGIVDDNAKINIPFGKEFVAPDISSKIQNDFINQYTQLVDNTSKQIIPEGLFSSNNIPKSQKNAIGGYFFENIISAVTGQFAKEGQDFDFYPASNANAYQKLFGNKFGKYSVADAKFEDNDNSTSSIKDKVINTLNNTSILDKYIQKFAKGGEVDSVPAMLTPGEFVINKRAASKIGKSSLERLNKADKVRKFATGGAVGSITSSPEKAFFAIGLLTQFVSQLDKSNKSLASLANIATTLGTTFITFSTIVGQAKNSDFVKNITGTNSDAAKARLRKAREVFNNLPATASSKEINAALKERRNAGIETIRTIKQNAFNNKVSLGAGIGGAGLSLFGGFLQDSANQRIQSGNGTSGDVTKAGVGSALALGGQGAALGSIFGPLGVAIGAATGGLIGFFTATRDAKNALEKADFDKKFTSFSKVLDRISSGKATAGSSASDINSGIADIQNRLLKARGEDRETLKGQIENSLTGIETFLNNLAASSKTFEEFQKVAGNSINFFAQQSAQSIESVNKSFKQSIETNNKRLEIDKKLIALRIKEYQNLRSFITITNAFNNVAGAADDVFDSLSSIASIANGEISKTNITKNGFATGDVNDIKTQSRIIDNLVGGGQANKVSQIAQLQKDLPDILLKLRNKAPLEGEGFVNTLVNELQGFDADIIKGIEAIANQKLVGGEGKDVEAINELFADLNGASKDLLRSFEPLIEVYKEAQNKLNDFFNKFAEKLDESIKLQAKEQQARLKNINLEEQIANIRAGISGQPLSFSQNLDFETRKTNQITGGLNPEQLAGVIAEAKRRLEEINAAMKANKGDDLGDLIRKRKENENIINEANRALEHLADVSERAAPYLKELEKLRGLRDFQQNIAKVLAVGSLQDRRNTAKGLTGAAIALKKGTFNGLAPAQQEQAFNTLQELSKFDDKIKEKFKKVFSNTLQSRGVSKERADAIAKNEATPQEQKIAEALEKVFADATSAQKNILKGFTDANNKFKQGIEEALKNFIIGLEQQGKDERDKIKKKQLDELEARKKAIGNKKIDRNNILKSINGNTDEDITNARLTLPDAKRRLELLDRRNRLESAIGTNTGKRLFNSLNTTETSSATGNIKNVNVNDIKEMIISGKLQKRLESFGLDSTQSTDAISKLQNIIAENSKNGVIGRNLLSNKFSEILNNELKSTLDKTAIELGNLNQSTSSLPDNIRNSVTELKKLEELLIKLGNVKLQDIEREEKEISEGEKILGKNSGGPIPGVGNTDTIPAMLTPGEFVLRKDAVKAIGLNNLYAMNATGYNNGGVVGGSVKEMLEQMKIQEELKNFKSKDVKNTIKNSTQNLDLALDFSHVKMKKGGFLSNRYLQMAQRRANRAKALRERTGYDTRLANKTLPSAFYNASGGYENMTSGAFKGRPLTRYYFNTSTGQTEGRDKLAKAKERVSILNYKRRGFASGGLVGGEGGGKGTGITINPESLSTFNQSITQFVTASDKLSTSLNNFPREITLNANHKLEVILNGAQVLAAMVPEMQNLIINETKTMLNDFIKDKLPDLGEIQ